MSSAHDSPVLTPESTRQYRRHVEEAVSFLVERAETIPSLGLVLDSKIGGLGASFDAHDRWEIENMPRFPVSEKGDGPTLSIGRLGDAPTTVLNGALSLHEGYTPREVVFPIRVLAEAGIDTLLFVNTAGTTSSEIEVEDLVLMADHINFQGANPLVGPNVEEWGPRFPDMTVPYDPTLRRIAETEAVKQGINLQSGVYFAVLGPNLGTPAEYRMAQRLGADTMGVTVVPEVIAARHMDVRVLGLSVITARCVPGQGRSAPGDGGGDTVDSARSSLRSLLVRIATSLHAEAAP